MESVSTKTASREFSIDRMVEHQLEIYESILKRDARQKSRKRDGAVICGAYGYGNAGDDAILKSIIRSVQELDNAMPITVLAKNTQSIKKRYRVGSIYTFNLPKMVAAMRKSVLYINGGGTLIQNATSWRSLWYYLFTLRLAKLLGNKVDMYGCGIGPVTGKKNIRLVKRVLDRSVDTITLRETDSMKELESFGVPYLTPFAASGSEREKGHGVIRWPTHRVKFRESALKTRNQRRQG
mgnify:FL=1